MIDLGEVGPPAPEPAIPLDLRRIGRALLAAVAILGLLGLGGSVRPEQRGLRPLWSAPFDGGATMWLSEDTAYLNRIVDGVATIKAYDLATGALRWNARVDDSVSYFQPEKAGGLLLMPARRATFAVKLPGGGLSTSEFAQATLALNAGTGVPVWRAPGDVQSVDADRGVVLVGDQDARGEYLTALRLLRLGDGGTLWSLPTPGLRAWSVAYAGGRPDKVITATGQGKVKIFRYADGTLLRSATLPWGKGKTEDGYYNDLSVAGDHLIVNRSAPDAGDVTVYRLDDLAALWSVRHLNGGITDCGPVLCLPDGSGVSGRDPQTGRQLWQVPSAHPAYLVGPDRLLADTGDDGGFYQLIEAGTGRLIGAAARGDSTAWFTAPHNAMLLLQNTTEPPGRFSVTQFDLTSGEQSLLGAIEPPEGFGCRSAAGYLACARGSRVEVTAVG